MEKTFKVTISYNNDVNGNFIRLPSTLAETIYSNGIPIQDFYFKLDSKWILSWDGFNSSDYSSNELLVVEINPILAQLLGNLKHGDSAVLSMGRLNPNDALSEVYVKPIKSDDWEIIENNAMFLQEELLNQVKIVGLNSPIVCSINNIVAKIQVDKIIPENKSFGRLDNGTLIIVEPKLNPIKHSKFINNTVKGNKEEIVTSVKRSLAWDIDHFNKISGLNVLVNDTDFISEYGYIETIDSNPSSTSKEKNKNDTFFPKRLAVKISQNSDLNIPKGHICISQLLWRSLGFNQPNNGLHLKLDFLINNPTPWCRQNSSLINDIVITITYYSKPRKIDETQCVEILKSIRYLTNNMVFCEIPTDVKSTLKFSIKIRANIKSIQEDIKYVDLSNCTNSQFIHKTSTQTLPPQFHQPSKRSSVINYCKTNNIIEDIINLITSPIMSSSGTLITGKQGTGKSTTALKLNEHLLRFTKCYTRYINCETLINSLTFDKLKKILDQWIYFGYIHQPSVLILDSSDFIFNQIQSEEGSPSSSSKSNISDKITHYLINSLEMVSRKFNNSIRVVFISRNKESMNNLLFDKHFIGKTWSIKTPTKDERIKLFEYFCQNKNLIIDSPLTCDKSLNFSDMALETEGYTPQDISNLVLKLYYQSKVQNINGSNDLNLITDTLFQSVLQAFTPSSLQNVKLQNNSKEKQGVKWSEIGGLQNAKDILLETLEWPTKYSPIFQNCPLRLRSGILLYGFPGCGKTLLASAVASQCGLNFISVKGPEILNKYIGASEQNVRELFERAESVKPCILFFDEFDSIAPKRGHDSTGVTDRVVNQLLTQMDGAEGLDGVYVLAATSRPDLIDPALLRPGRLDKSVKCDIPNESERLDILKRIIFKNRIHLKDESCVNEIARLTINYSGADLQGLCYSANLKGIHRKLTREEERIKEEQQSQLNKSDINDKLNKRHEFMIINGTKTDKENDIISQSITVCRQKKTKEGTELNSGSNQENQESKTKETYLDMIITTEDFINTVNETKASISMGELQKLTHIYNKFENLRNNTNNNSQDEEASTDIGTRLSLM